MRRIDDRIAAFGLILVTFTAWGPNAFGSQAFVMACVGFASLSFASGRRAVAALCLYITAWLLYLYSGVSAGTIPQGAEIQAVDSVPLYMAALGLYVIVKRGRMSTRAWMNVICSTSLALSVLGILQWYFVGEATATLGCSNFLAAFLAVSAPFFFRRKWICALPVLLLCLAATKTSTAVLALCVAAGFYWRRWIGAVIACVPAVTYWMLFKTPKSLFDRLDFWADALSKVSGSWSSMLFGVGPGILWIPDGALHSEYVYTLFNFGIIGLVLFAACIMTCFRETGNRIAQAALVAVCVDAIGNHVLHTAPTAALAVVVMGIVDRK